MNLFLLCVAICTMPAEQPVKPLDKPVWLIQEPVPEVDPVQPSDTVAQLLASADREQCARVQREVLIEMQATFRAERQFLKSMRVGKVLRNRRLFNRLLDRSMEAAAERAAEMQATGETVGADGEFIQWFLDWLQNGGFEQIIQWIMLIIDLFSQVELPGDWHAVAGAGWHQLAA